MPLATASTEVVLFAITSAIKLGNQVRQSFVNNLQAEKLTIPLPNVDMSVDNFQITDFFTAHQHFLKGNDQLESLFQAQQQRNLDDAESKAYKQLFEIAYIQENQDANALIQGDNLGALLQYRQWANDADAPPSGLRLIGGSLVEIGIDYFQQVPGALNENSANGKSVKKLLTALDEVDFTSGNLKAALYQQVAPVLFSSAIETINRLAPEISQDEKVQGFIQTATKGFAEDMTARLDGLATQEETQSVKQWGQSIFRSLVKNSGEAAFQSDFFNDGKAESELIKSTGLAFMEVMLDSGRDKIDLAKVFSAKSLDKVMGAAMFTVSQHPELVSKNDFVKRVITDVGMAVVDADISKKDLIPELSRLVLAKSADNLTALINISNDNPNHLLVTATQTILQSLAVKPEEGKWKPQFTKKQTAQLANVLLDEVVQNPSWITDQVGNDSLLSEVMNVTLASLKGIPADKRLSANTVKALITANVKAVAINQMLLKKFPVGAEGREQAALGYFLEGMFGYLYGDQEAMDKNMALAKTTVMEETLERLLTSIANQPVTVALVDQTLELEFNGVENKWMNSFLQSINGVSFEKGFQNAVFQQIAPEFMSAAIQISAELSPQLSDDPKFQQLIQVTANGLAQGLTQRLESANDPEAKSLKVWSNELLKSLTWQTGELVLSSSSDFFGTNEAESVLIKNTGLAFLELVTKGDADLKNVLKGDSLDGVIQAALSSVSQYPEVFTSSASIQTILSEVTSAVVDSGVKKIGLVPEILRLTLEKTADNLDLIWSPDSESTDNIMALATKNILSALTKPAESGKWKPRFSTKQMLGLTNSVLDEVIQNPVWVTSKIGADSALSVALNETFKAMQAIPADKRLYSDSVQLLLTNTVKTVAVRKNLLDIIPGASGEQQTVLNYAMDSLFAYMYGQEDAKAKWGITKVQMANTIFEHYLNKLAIQPANKETVDANMNLLIKELDKATQNAEFDTVMFLKGFLG